MLITEKNLLQKIESAEAGRNVWNMLLSKFGSEECRFIVFPHDDSEYKIIFQHRLDDFIELYHFHNICIVEYENNMEFYTNKECQISYILLKKKEIEDLISLYELGEFTNKLYIMSVTLPEGRCGDNVIKKYGVSLDEVVTYGILRFDKIYY